MLKYRPVKCCELFSERSIESSQSLKSQVTIDLLRQQGVAILTCD